MSNYEPNSRSLEMEDQAYSPQRPGQFKRTSGNYPYGDLANPHAPSLSPYVTAYYGTGCYPQPRGTPLPERPQQPPGLPERVKFDGVWQSNWVAFIQSFEDYAWVQGWDSEQCAIQLSCALYGPAAECMERIKREQPYIDYDDLVNRLGGKFGGNRFPDILRLNYETQSIAENHFSWADRVRRLAMSAYPDSLFFAERKATMRFCLGLRNRGARDYVCALRPCTMKDALKMIDIWCRQCQQARIMAESVETPEQHSYPSGYNPNQQGALPPHSQGSSPYSPNSQWAQGCRSSSPNPQSRVWVTREEHTPSRRGTLPPRSRNSSPARGPQAQEQNKPKLEPSTLEELLREAVLEIKDLKNKVRGRSPSTRRAPQGCFRCGDRGHLKRECPMLSLSQSPEVVSEKRVTFKESDVGVREAENLGIRNKTLCVSLTPPENPQVSLCIQHEGATGTLRVSDVQKANEKESGEGVRLADDCKIKDKPLSGDPTLPEGPQVSLCCDHKFAARAAGPLSVCDESITTEKESGGGMSGADDCIIWLNGCDASLVTEKENGGGVSGADDCIIRLNGCDASLVTAKENGGGVSGAEDCMTPIPEQSGGSIPSDDSQVGLCIDHERASSATGLLSEDDRSIMTEKESGRGVNVAGDCVILITEQSGSETALSSLQVGVGPDCGCVSPIARPQSECDIVVGVSPDYWCVSPIARPQSECEIVNQGPVMTDEECEEFFRLLDNHVAQIHSEGYYCNDNVQIGNGSQDQPGFTPNRNETRRMNVLIHSPSNGKTTEMPVCDKTREAITRPRPVSACTVSVKVGNTIIEAGLDTASEVTMISHNISRSIAKQAPASDAAGFSDLSAIVCCVGPVEIEIGGRVYSQNVCVALTGDDMRLGIDFLQYIGAVIDVGRGVLRTDSWEVPLTIRVNSVGNTVESYNWPSPCTDPGGSEQQDRCNSELECSSPNIEQTPIMLGPNCVLFGFGSSTGIPRGRLPPDKGSFPCLNTEQTSFDVCVDLSPLSSGSSTWVLSEDKPGSSTQVPSRSLAGSSVQVKSENLSESPTYVPLENLPGPCAPAPSENLPGPLAPTPSESLPGSLIPVRSDHSHNASACITTLLMKTTLANQAKLQSHEEGFRCVVLTPFPPFGDPALSANSPERFAQADPPAVQATLGQPLSPHRAPRVTPGVASLSLICQALLSVRPQYSGLPDYPAIPFQVSFFLMEPFPSAEPTISDTISVVPAPHGLDESTWPQSTMAVSPTPNDSRMNLQYVVAAFRQPNTDPSQGAVPRFRLLKCDACLFSLSAQQAEFVRYGETGLDGAQPPVILFPQGAQQPRTQILQGAQPPVILFPQGAQQPRTQILQGAQPHVILFQQGAQPPVIRSPQGAQPPLPRTPQEALSRMTHIPPGARLPMIPTTQGAVVMELWDLLPAMGIIIGFQHGPPNPCGRTLQALAQMLGLTLEDVGEVTSAMAHRLYFPGDQT